MSVIKNASKMNRNDDNKSMAKVLVKAGTNEVRDPYILFNPEDSQSECTVGYAIIYPGCKTSGHTHEDVEEVYHIVRGEGVMTIGDKNYNIKAGDTFIVPLYNFHSTENTGNMPLELFWTLVKVNK
jgi:mannose-6-phosphate isomerase-like protein (cupin superfamily)